MKRHLFLATAALCLAGCESSTTDADTWALRFSDEFDGAAGALPNVANWKFDVGTDWGNAQLEYDTDRATNASTDGKGFLVITARKEAFQGRQYTSARITTEGLKTFKYGRIEARMKLPSGRGLWPAFWLLGANRPTVGWPQSGEIDIMEYRGQAPGTVIGSLHGPGYSGGNALTKDFSPTATRFDNSFHVFSIEWNPLQIDYFVDGARYQTIQRFDAPGEWVFDKPFYIILNVAVGGNFVGSPDAITSFPQTMMVDWVRVYELNP
jgi:beta-glucanase (GH16 family)